MRVPATWRRALFGAAVTAACVLGVHSASRASLFGEENVTLGAILSESIRSYEELRSITDALGESVELAGELVDAAERAQAGVEELAGYSVGAFLGDVKEDVYDLYPGLGRIAHGGARLRAWDRSHTASPFTAYEVVSALAGDLAPGLRADVEAGRRTIDGERVLQTEAAGGLALADVSEEVTRGYDREIHALRERFERRASPGTAALVAAHANLLLAEQQSHLIRLLARTVRLDGVDKALRAADRLGAIGDTYRRTEAAAELAHDALRPPTLLRFDPVGW